LSYGHHEEWKVTEKGLIILKTGWKYSPSLAFKVT